MLLKNNVYPACKLRILSTFSKDCKTKPKSNVRDLLCPATPKMFTV